MIYIKERMKDGKVQLDMTFREYEQIGDAMAYLHRFDANKPVNKTKQYIRFEFEPKHLVVGIDIPSERLSNGKTRIITVTKHLISYASAKSTLLTGGSNIYYDI